MSDPDALDPRWEWFAIRAMCDREPTYVKGACNHLDVVPVNDSTGLLVAGLCLTCDTQLPMALVTTSTPKT